METHSLARGSKEERSFVVCLSWPSVDLSPGVSLSLCSVLCAESLYGDSTDKPLLDCCACGTAKYRVTFYGNWSEKTHPKDYPRKQPRVCGQGAKTLGFLSYMIGLPRANRSTQFHSHLEHLLLPLCSSSLEHKCTINQRGSARLSRDVMG